MVAKTDTKEFVACRNAIAKHKENIRKWERMISEAEKAIVFNENKIKRLEGLEYYVYVVYVDAVPKYVGKGKGGRYKHAVSGMSSCPELNRDYFANKYIEVVYAEKHLTEDKALALEANWIGNFKERARWGRHLYDFYNKDIPTTYEFYDECANYIYHNLFVHAIDNSSNDGVVKVRPPYSESIYEKRDEEGCE